MGVGLAVSYLCTFSLHCGPAGIWYGFMAGLISAGILLAARIRRRIREAKMLPAAGPPIV
jgi:MATE family multidrug resistance protein